MNLRTKYTEIISTYEPNENTVLIIVDKLMSVSEKQDTPKSIADEKPVKVFTKGKFEVKQK